MGGWCYNMRGKCLWVWQCVGGGEGGGGGAGVKYNRQGMYQHMQRQNCLVASFTSQCQGLKLRVLKTLTSNLGCKAGSKHMTCQQKEHYNIMFSQKGY